MSPSFTDFSGPAKNPTFLSKGSNNGKFGIFKGFEPPRNYGSKEKVAQDNVPDLMT